MAKKNMYVSMEDEVSAFEEAVSQRLEKLISITSADISKKDERRIRGDLIEYVWNHAISMHHSEERVLSAFLFEKAFENPSDDDSLSQALSMLCTRNTAMCIGERIKKARNKAHMSQSELAKRLGKTLRSIQKYERGEVEPSITLLYSIASTLDISPAVLFAVQQPDMAMKNLGDVLGLFFELNKKNELRFEIEDLPAESGKKGVAIEFISDKKSPRYNQLMCALLLDFSRNRYFCEEGLTGYDSYVDFLIQTRDQINLLEKAVLTEKTVNYDLPPLYADVDYDDEHDYDDGDDDEGD